MSALFGALGFREFLLARRLALRAQRSGVILFAHHLTPSLCFHLLEDSAGVTRGDPTVSAALRTASAKSDALSAVWTNDDQRVRELEFLLALGVQTIQKRSEIAEGLLERHGADISKLHGTCRSS